MDKEKLTEKKEIILGLLKDFCKAKLNEEYFVLAEKMVQKLARKRTVPFATGKSEIWAASIIHALGIVNFLFDKSADPYITIDDIADFFGTNKTTTTSKSKQIRDLLKISYFDKEFSLKKRLNSFENLLDFIVIQNK